MLPVAALLAYAVGAGLAARWFGASSRVVGGIAWVGLGSAGVLLADAWQFWRLHGVQEAGATRIDGFGLFFSFVAVATGVLAVGSGLARGGGLRHPAVLTAVAGLILALSTRDLALLVAGVEIAAWSLLLLPDAPDSRSLEATTKYLAAATAATGFTAFGAAFLYGACGSLDLGALAAHAGAADPFFRLGLGLFVIGVGLRLGWFPFCFPAVDVFSGGSAPVAGLVASVVPTAMLAAYARVFLTGFDSVRSLWEPFVGALGVAGICGCGLLALGQGPLRRLVAYATVAQSSCLLIALVCEEKTAIPVLAFGSVAHVLTVWGLFSIADVLSAPGDVTTSWSGRGRVRPWASGVLFFLLLSWVGIPPGGGFVARFALLWAALAARQLFLSLVVAAGGFLLGYAVLRAFVTLWVREPDGAAPGEAAHPESMVVAVVAAGLLLLLGVVPGSAYELLGSLAPI